MKTDKQILCAATTHILQFLSESGADSPVRKRHCLAMMKSALEPFEVLCDEHAHGRHSSNSVVARKALAEINKTLFPLVVSDQPKKH